MLLKAYSYYVRMPRHNAIKHHDDTTFILLDEYHLGKNTFFLGGGEVVWIRIGMGTGEHIY